MTAVMPLLSPSPAKTMTRADASTETTNSVTKTTVSLSPADGNSTPVTADSAADQAKLDADSSQPLIISELDADASNPSEKFAQVFASSMQNAEPVLEQNTMPQSANLFPASGSTLPQPQTEGQLETQKPLNAELINSELSLSSSSTEALTEEGLLVTSSSLTEASVLRAQSGDQPSNQSSLSSVADNKTQSSVALSRDPVAISAAMSDGETIKSQAKGLDVLSPTPVVEPTVNAAIVQPTTVQPTTNPAGDELALVRMDGAKAQTSVASASQIQLGDNGKLAMPSELVNTLQTSANQTDQLQAKLSATNISNQQFSASLDVVQQDGLSEAGDRQTTLNQALISNAAKSMPTVKLLGEQLIGQGQAQAAFGQPNWGEKIFQQVSWFSNRNINFAEIKLDPPELGALQVRVTHQGDQTQINFSSPHANVRESLDQNMPRLREMFEQMGLNLADVNVGDDRQNFSNNENKSGNSDSGEFDESDDIVSNGETMEPVIVSNHLVDETV